jgi:hypothetical protein
MSADTLPPRSGGQAVPGSASINASHVASAWRQRRTAPYPKTEINSFPIALDLLTHCQP